MNLLLDTHIHEGKYHVSRCGVFVSATSRVTSKSSFAILLPAARQDFSARHLIGIFTPLA